MFKPPKSSAEILAAAKRAFHQPVRPRTPETDTFNHHFSVFSTKPSLPTLITNESTTPSLPSQFGPANVHRISNLCFVDPVTPQTLKAAVEIKEMAQMRKERDEDLFEDDPDVWVF